MSGPLALVGGGEWQTGCDFDAELLAASGTDEVVVLPTAAAYEHPHHAVERASRWFETLDARVRGVHVVDRTGAHDEANAAIVRAARFVYLSDGSPMHLRSVLMQSPLWDALVAAWQDGAVLAASGAGAMVLCDPAVDPRGGAVTLGLGLIRQFTLVARADTWSEDKLHRTLQLTPAGVPLVEVDERTALIHDGDGGRGGADGGGDGGTAVDDAGAHPWRAAGAGTVNVWLDGHQADVPDLPALSARGRD